MLNKKRFALSLAIVCVTLKFIYLAVVAISPAIVQTFVNWMSQIHSVQRGVQILPINWINAVIVLLGSFVVPYIF